MPLPTIPSKRTRRRLVRHHLPFAVASFAAVAILYATRSYSDVLSRASFATAYPALIFLVATLLIGPWNVIRKQRNPVSSDLRRDLGIWAGILGVVHAATGQFVHLRGRPWLYYIYDRRDHQAFPIRHDLFGIANYTGALAVLLLVLLLATSNDYSLRALGTPRWKQLQRWNYAAFTLTAIHSVAYQGVETQKTGWVVIVALCVLITLGLQTVGFFRRRAQLASS